MIKIDKVSSIEYKSIRKSGNKIVKNLAKLKNRNLLKSRFENLSQSKKIQRTSVTK